MTSTTLSKAITANATGISLADASHVVVGGFMRLEEERCEVLAINPIFVKRGASATAAVAHAAGVTVQVGLASEFAPISPGMPAPSDSGTVLTSAGSGAVPSFQPAAGGGGGGNTDINFNAGHGIGFAGTVSPITMVGGDDGFGDSAIVFDNPADSYISLTFAQKTEFDVVGDLVIRPTGTLTMGIGSGGVLLPSGTALGPVAVGSLPSSTFLGQLAVVTNGQNGGSPGDTVTGTGTSKYLVGFNGVNWKIVAT